MKRLGFLLVIAFVAIGAVSAQNWGATQSVTFEGTLQLQNGQIAVSNGNTVYFVPVLTQYVGFIEGLKEGTRVSVSGYAYGNVLQPIQVTINGKPYDFSPNNSNQGWGGYGTGWCGGWGRGGGMMGYGGYGHHRGRW